MHMLPVRWGWAACAVLLVYLYVPAAEADSTIQTQNIRVTFNETGADMCPTCFRFRKSGGPSNQYFQVKYAGFWELYEELGSIIECPSNGTWGSGCSRHVVNSLPADFLVNDSTSDCFGCSAARTFTGSVPVGNSSMVLKVPNWLYSAEATVTNGNDTITVPANTMKYSVDVTDWPFSTSVNHSATQGFRITLELKGSGIPRSHFSCEYSDGVVDDCGTPRSGLLAVIVKGGSTEGRFGFYQKCTTYDSAGAAGITHAVVVHGPNPGADSSTRMVYIDTPTFAHKLEYDPDVSLSNGAFSANSPVWQPFLLLLATAALIVTRAGM